MKTTAMIVGIVGAMFLTSTSVIAQTERGNQKLGAPGAALESDKDIGAAGARDSSANQKLGTPGAALESDKDIGATRRPDSPANQKLGVPGAAPESDKNIGPGPGASNPATGSDNKPTNRRSAPSKEKK
jgi:hypothetical protein